jgi:hypothetical protein
MKSRKIEGRSEKRWDLVCIVASSFICAYRRQCDDTFLKKKMHFCFNYPRDPIAGLRSQKV